MKGFNQMDKLLKQAQKMQAEVAKAQEEITQMELEFSAGGGAVTIVINGNLQIQSLKLDQEVVDPKDIETLEDLLISAVNGAMTEMRAKSEARMSKATGGMSGFPGMPF